MDRIQETPEVERRREIATLRFQLRIAEVYAKRGDQSARDALVAIPKRLAEIVATEDVTVAPPTFSDEERRDALDGAHRAIRTIVN